MSDDIKALVADLGKTFADFQAANDKRLEAIKAGAASSDVTAKVEKINAEITTLQAAIDEAGRATGHFPELWRQHPVGFGRAAGQRLADDRVGPEERGAPLAIGREYRVTLQSGIGGDKRDGDDGNGLPGHRLRGHERHGHLRGERTGEGQAGGEGGADAGDHRGAR